ncbi:hypothetical protein EJ110_NYTH06470 [Nymphaea thermarum]|nr:hypothetical protein EJ110_NYTH06470 [Nymphaea thermarum]
MELPGFRPSFFGPFMMIPYFNLCRFIPTEESLRMKKLNQEATIILQDIIRKRIEEMKTDDARTGDLLTLLLEAYMVDTDPNEPESFKKAGISMDGVVEECKLFYARGLLLSY